MSRIHPPAPAKPELSTEARRALRWLLDWQHEAPGLARALRQCPELAEAIVRQLDQAPWLNYGPPSEDCQVALDEFLRLTSLD